MDPQADSSVFETKKTELFDPDVMLKLVSLSKLPSNQRRDLKNYRRRRQDSNKVVTVYRFGKNWESLERGRLMAEKASLQGFEKNVRAALASRYYWDIDTVNAQPVILEQFCKQKGWVCPLLSTYVAKRREVLAYLMETTKCSRDEAKDFCLATLFGGKVGAAIQEPFLESLSKELSLVCENAAKAHPDLLKHASKLKADANDPSCRKDPRASVLAILCQDEERKILMEIDKALAARGRSMDVYIHDGGLVRKLQDETHFPPHLLREVESDVLASTGYSIALEVKPMQTNLDLRDTRKLTPLDVLINDSYAAKQFVELLGDMIVLDKSGVRYVFDETTGLWTNDEDALRKWLNIFAPKLTFYQESSNGIKTFDYSGKESNIKNMFANLNRHLTPIDFVASRADSGIGKFLFSNGIYDLQTNSFTEGFDPSILFFGRISRPFPSEIEEEVVERIQKLLFEDPYMADQAEQARFFKIGLARALYGDYRAKRCYITVGEANCGRGLLTGALQACYESYVDSFDSNSLLYNPRDGADEAKRNAWLVPIANCRLAISNEIRMSSRSMDGALLKSAVSGGDILKARLNYQNADGMVMRATLLIQTNDMPAIKPADSGVLNRVCVNELVKTYKESPEPGNLKQMKEDRTLKALFETTPYKDALFYLMCQTWREFVEMGRTIEKPLAVQTAIQEWIETSVSVKDLLEETYEITKCEDDTISAREVIDYLRDKGCVESETKIGRSLSALGCGVLRKKIGGAVKVMRTGLRKMQAEEDQGL